MFLRLPALPAPPQLMRVVMPHFCLLFLSKDPLTCHATLSPSSKLNYFLSVMFLPSSATPSLFHARLPAASHPPQAWSSCLFAFEHPFNTSENGLYTSGYRWRRAAIWLGSVLQSATEGVWFWIRAELWAPFHPVLPEEAAKTPPILHSLQQNYSGWQYWPDPLPIKLKQGWAYAAWCSSLWKNLGQQKYRGHLSLLLHIG